MLLGMLEDRMQDEAVVLDRMIDEDKVDTRFLGKGDVEDRLVLGMMVFLFVSGTFLEATFL